jgi:quercetin dioxygenase-like cupin family protein
MEQNEFRQILATERFDEIVEVSKPANDGMGTHTHPFDAKALITHGELSIAVDDVLRSYKVGDIFQLAANTPHSEQYGPDGVSYLVGRKNT